MPEIQGKMGILVLVYIRYYLENQLAWMVIQNIDEMQEVPA